VSFTGWHPVNFCDVPETPVIFCFEGCSHWNPFVAVSEMLCVRISLYASALKVHFRDFQPVLDLFEILMDIRDIDQSFSTPVLDGINFVDDFVIIFRNEFYSLHDFNLLSVIFAKK
jgi:hypothetical protein